jgi:hypothetical protein
VDVGKRLRVIIIILGHFNLRDSRKATPVENNTTIIGRVEQQ